LTPWVRVPGEIGKEFSEQHVRLSPLRRSPFLARFASRLLATELDPSEDITSVEKVAPSYHDQKGAHDQGKEESRLAVTLAIALVYKVAVAPSLLLSICPFYNAHPSSRTNMRPPLSYSICGGLSIPASIPS
jgi:hypothetical protein